MPCRDTAYRKGPGDAQAVTIPSSAPTNNSAISCAHVATCKAERFDTVLDESFALASAIPDSFVFEQHDPPPSACEFQPLDIEYALVLRDPVVLGEGDQSQTLSSQERRHLPSSQAAVEE
jgi:hypothetical protein